MSETAVPTVYDPVWKSLHWLTVALVVAELGIGWTMSGPRLFSWHASLGVTILGVTLVRFFWRVTHVEPPVPPTLRPWEVLVLTLVQVFFYVFLFAQPLLGWALYSLSPRYTLFFGLAALPKLPVLSGMHDAALLRDVLEGAHGTVAALLAGVIVLHAGAAGKHHFVIRDDVLLRMAPAGFAFFLDKLRGKR